MKIAQHKSDILSPKPVEMGFTVGKDLEYAAVPVVGSDTKLAIVYNAQILKVCRNRKSALNFIQKHKKAEQYRRAGANGPLG